MRLVPRLMLIGVAAPVTALVAAAFVTGTIFRIVLENDLEQRLYALATVESVSAFDGPRGEPHLHMPERPLSPDFESLLPGRSLYAPDGSLVATTDPAAHPHLTHEPGIPDRPDFVKSEPGFSTLVVGVQRPGFGVYSLVLHASLEPIDRTMRAFARSATLTTLAVALILTALVLFQARNLSRRIRAITTLGPMLKGAAPLDATPVEGGDELSELHQALGDAASFVAEQRQRQERFLANAAHQLRTPLAVLQTEIDLALRKPRSPDAFREALFHARDETQELTALAKKLLDFESLSTQEVATTPVELAEMAREVVRRQGPTAAAKELAVDVTADREVWTRGDPEYLSQAVSNVVENAIRFSPARGRIQVTVSEANGHGRLTVADEGPGIPLEERPRVFEPFFRGRAEGSQTGLGLAFASDVARRHGGRIVLDDVPTGTSFSFELPAEQPQPRALA